MKITNPPTLEHLILRAQQLAGRTLGEIALQQKIAMPSQLLYAKGWIGQLIENVLGATAGNLPTPDFPHLGVELKTIPINAAGKPSESTYVCTVPLISESLQWEQSVVWQKLKKVLWIPIESHAQIKLVDRRIGTPILWQPTPAQAQILKQDWEEFMTQISLGQLEHISAKQGVYLQIRPKAAHHRVTTSHFDDEGQLSSTLPRGFYLRSQFTQQVLR